jgi:predicted secreted Zn-dependent protease
MQDWRYACLLREGKRFCKKEADYLYSLRNVIEITTYYVKGRSGRNLLEGIAYEGAERID